MITISKLLETDMLFNILVIFCVSFSFRSNFCRLVFKFLGKQSIAAIILGISAMARVNEVNGGQ